MNGKAPGRRRKFRSRRSRSVDGGILFTIGRYFTDNKGMRSDIRKLSEAAERLRAVKKAHERFLAAWALECIWDQPAPLDRARAAIETSNGASSADWISRLDQ